MPKHHKRKITLLTSASQLLDRSLSSILNLLDYGHLALETTGHNPKHCLTYGSNPEDPTLISHDYCSFKDDESQTANFFSYVVSSSFAAVYLGGPKGESKDYYVTLSDDGVVHLNSGKVPEGTQEYFLSLPDDQD